MHGHVILHNVRSRAMDNPMQHPARFCSDLQIAPTLPATPLIFAVPMPPTHQSRTVHYATTLRSS